MTNSSRIDATKLTSHPLGISAVEFMDMTAHQHRVDEAAALFLAEPYIQHNPRAASGIEEFRTGMTALLSAQPNRRYDIKRVLVDGNFVVLHSHVTNGPDDPGTAIVDIFRAQDGKFVEHWDVQQPLPTDTGNGNGSSMF